MRAGRPSTSAQHIALARAHLTRVGILDDTYAEGFLRPPWRIALKSSRILGLARLAGHRAFAYIAARTRFYDRLVTSALDNGIQQVVILAAGYDTRAWRLARRGVQFVEVDHPDTQNHKRAHAPPGGPLFVAADLAVEPVAEVLRSSRLLDTPTVFTCEGLTMYLEEGSVRDLLGAIAGLSRPTSRLGVDFGIGPAPDQHLWRIAFRLNRAVAAVGGEPIRFELDPSAVSTLLLETGWRQLELLTGPQMHERFLRDTGLPVPPAVPGAYVVTAEIPLNAEG